MGEDQLTDTLEVKFLAMIWGVLVPRIEGVGAKSLPVTVKVAGLSTQPPPVPIRILVHMNNAAGIFQVDELFKDKLEGSGLESYIEVEASTEGEADKKLIKTFRI